jgi:uncharacterized protein YukE
VPLSDNIKKTKDSKAALDELTKLYGGQASVYSETFAGKLAILNQRWNEFKDAIGQKLIDKLLGILPYVDRVIQVLSGDADTSLSSKVKSLRRGLDGDGNAGADSLAKSLQAVGKSFITLYDAIIGGKAGDANDRLNNTADALNNIAKAINAIAGAWKWLTAAAKQDVIDVKKAGSFGSLIWSELNKGPAGWVGDLFKTALHGVRANGGPVTGGRSYLVGERGPEIFTPNGSGYITPHGAGGTTIILNGIVDGESARRSIERLIQQSQRRTGAINWSGAIS